MYEFPHSTQFDSDLREILQDYGTLKNLPKEWEEFESRISETIGSITRNWLETNLPNIVHPYVLVDDFGAVGDGETDDTAAIQSALDYAAENGRYVIFAPLKTYFVNTVTNYAALRLPTNTHIIGNGATLVAGQFCHNSFLMVNKSDGITGSYIANKNITIESLNFDGQYLTSTLIGIGHAENIKILNCNFSRLEAWHMIELNAVMNGIIDGCSFKEYYGPSATEMVQLDCMESPQVFPAFGPYDGTHCSGIRITNCHFGNYNHPGYGYTTASSNASGIGNHTILNTHEPHEVVISNNTFTSLASGIKFADLAGATITNNIIYSCYNGINCGGGRLVNIVVANNELYGYTSDEAANQGRGINLGANANTAINGATNVIVEANTVANFCDYGISVNGNHFSVLNNRVTNIVGRNAVGGRGIAAAYAASDAFYSGNTVTACNDVAFYAFNNASSNIYITNNIADYIFSLPSANSQQTYLIGNIVNQAAFGDSKQMNNIVNGELLPSSI